jgi:hypothetical protein
MHLNPNQLNISPGTEMFARDNNNTGKAVDFLGNLQGMLNTFFLPAHLIAQAGGGGISQGSGRGNNSNRISTSKTEGMTDHAGGAAYPAGHLCGQETDAQFTAQW